MNVEFKDKNATSAFLKREVVFKITSTKKDGTIRDKDMVTSLDDYERRLTSIPYHPLIYLAPLHLRLAYLYHCLNNTKDIPRDETYTFWWRKLRTHKWFEWFVVYPYSDSTQSASSSPRPSGKGRE